MLDTLASGVDRAFHSMALARGRRSRARSRSESLGPTERIAALTRLCALYDDPRLIDEPETFFGPRPEAVLQRRRVRGYHGQGEVLDLSWQSRCEPFLADVAERYLAESATLVAHARLIAHTDRPRPTAILLHGYLGGHYHLEERAWPVRWFFERGMDVALPVLPFHALRSGGRRPRFPHSDPRMTIEGFRQAVLDLRTLMDHLERRGAPQVGVMGMSLGGYTTALLATVDPRLAFAVPFIPLASIADFARDNGRLVGTAAEQAEQHRLLAEVHRVVSPLARPPRIDRDRILVVAARGDRITPLHHAERIAESFGAPLEVFTGGHLLQLGRSKSFRAIGRLLGGLGLFS